MNSLESLILLGLLGIIIIEFCSELGVPNSKKIKYIRLVEIALIILVTIFTIILIYT